MTNVKYEPGSVTKLLATELPIPGKETKLQALFSKPVAQTSSLTIRKKACYTS